MRIDVTSRFTVALRDELMKIGKDADCLSEEELKACLQRAMADAKKPTLEKLASQMTYLNLIVEQVLESASKDELTPKNAKELLGCLRSTNRQVDELYR